MSMFQNPDDEEKLCQILKAYVEEWGAESVIVSVPKDWKGKVDSRLGRVRLQFSTDNTISIAVDHWSGRISFNVQLRKAG